MGKGGAAAKQDDFQPHPVKDQLPGVAYCVTSPPNWPEAILLGFQHYLLTLGLTAMIPSILVPLMGGGHREKAEVIQTLLFVTGINTLLHSLFGTRLPAVIGGSFTYLLPTFSIIFARRYSFILDPHQRFLSTMRGIQGALIIASFFQMIVGFLGFWRNVLWLLTPLSAVPLVTMVGLGLFMFGFPLLANCVEIGLPELIIIILVSQYLPRLLRGRRAIFERFSVLISVAIVWLYAHILTVGGAYDNKATTTQLNCRTDRSGLVGGAPWIKVPYPFQWGKPTFHVGEAFAMMAASFVALIESTGAIIAIARYGSATPTPPSVLSRGIGWLGIGLFLSGIFGTANGTAVSVENAGLLALTRVGSRRVIQIAACFMLFFSILASAGLGLLQFCNLNSFRTKFSLGFSLFMGFFVPDYFCVYFGAFGRYPVHTGSTTFNNIVNVIFLSNATVAVLVALLLDSTLDIGDSSIRKESGIHW